MFQEPKKKFFLIRFKNFNFCYLYRNADVRRIREVLLILENLYIHVPYFYFTTGLSLSTKESIKYLLPLEEYWLKTMCTRFPP